MEVIFGSMCMIDHLRRIHQDIIDKGDTSTEKERMALSFTSFEM